MICGVISTEGRDASQMCLSLTIASFMTSNVAFCEERFNVVFPTEDSENFYLKLNDMMSKLNVDGVNSQYFSGS